MYFGVQKVWNRLEAAFLRENQESDITAPPPRPPPPLLTSRTLHDIITTMFPRDSLRDTEFFPFLLSISPSSQEHQHPPDSSHPTDRTTTRTKKTKAVSLGREDVMTQYELCSTCGPGPSQTLDDSKIQTKAKKKNNTVLWLRFLHVFVIKCSLCCLLSFSFCLVEKKKKKGWQHGGLGTRTSHHKTAITNIPEDLQQKTELESFLLK